MNIPKPNQHIEFLIESKTQKITRYEGVSGGMWLRRNHPDVDFIYEINIQGIGQWLIRDNPYISTHGQDWKYVHDEEQIPASIRTLPLILS